MIRNWSVLYVLLLAFFAALAWAENPAVGKWSCTSVDERGTPLNWTLSVKEDGGKLSASIADLPDGGTVDLLDPKLDGSTLTFKVPVNPEEIVDVTLKIDGKNLEGTFSGKTSGKGTVKGAKQS
jgi:hypothetical protein